MWITGPEWYFDFGKSALDCIKSALATTRTVPNSILDFPCGHGRICRMLRASFPDADPTFCDLDRDGVDFCATQFNATAFYSHHDIRRVNLDWHFDLIWCGSLFTHLDAQQWPDFLGFFDDHLCPDGTLVFTTQGRQPIQWMQEGYFDYGLSHEEQQTLIQGYVRAGFGFISPPNQAFGISLSSMAFDCRQLEWLRSLRLIGFHEAGWAGHQDVVSCIRLRKPWPNLDTLDGRAI
jgi:cyclopropane fatty-acyl-phospholipid synthase-like methyltransferase